MSHKLTTIPLSQLKPSKANMRKTDKLVGIEELAASIAANGLLENLVVHPVNGESYEVVAGGRRLAALKQLAKAKKLDRDHPVACLVIKNGADLHELSLTENFERVPPHPADQFEAFAKLVADGRTPEEVASRFGISVHFVEQRLKLAHVSPKLVAQYREGAMTLEQLMAFTVSDDQTLQEEIWFDRSYENMPANFIKRQLTRSQVEASDRRVLFVGLQAYEAAGGTVIRDLFDSANDGYLADSLLLDRLVAEKLETFAQAFREEGWSWVETLEGEDHFYSARFHHIPVTEIELSKKEEKRLSRLAKRYDAIISALEDEENEEARLELDAIESEMNALRAKKEVWPDEDKVRSGVVIALGHDGTLSVTRGLIRREERTKSPESEVADKPKPVRGGYPEAVLQELSAQKTAALRATLANQPRTAFLLLLHALVAQVFLGKGFECIEIRVTETALDRASETIGMSKAAQTLQACRLQMGGKPDFDGLWDWLLKLEEAERHSLLAYCVAASINGLRTSQHREADGVEELATILNLDMTEWWSADEAFFARLSKADVLAAVKEALDDRAVYRLSDLKKSELAKTAAQLMAGKTWLPPPLRPTEAPSSEAKG